MRAKMAKITAQSDTDGAESESSSGRDELSVHEMMKWDCVERRKMEDRMRMNNFRGTDAHKESIGPRPIMSGPGHLPQVPTVDWTVFGVREPTAAVQNSQKRF
jgi:hypothetical protein